MTYSTNTDFSRDLPYKIRVFINCACVPGSSIDYCTLFKRRCTIIVIIIHLCLNNVQQSMGKPGTQAQLGLVRRPSRPSVCSVPY